MEFGPTCTYRANPHESKCVGENQFREYSKELARELGYTNPETNTGHGTRGGGISLVGNSKCGPATTLGYSRHGDLKMTATYHKPNMDDRLRGSLALQKLDADEIHMNGEIGTFRSVTCVVIYTFILSSNLLFNIFLTN